MRHSEGRRKGAGTETKRCKLQGYLDSVAHHFIKLFT